MSMHFRPKIQNGAVAKRTRTVQQPVVRPTPTPRSAKASPFATVAPIWSGVSVGALAQSSLAAIGLDGRLQSTEVAAQEKTEARPRALLGLIGCGVLLAGGFMFSLRDHFTAHAFGLNETQLKSEIERAETERQHLDVTLKRANSPQALEQAARSNGLAPLELERGKVVIGAKKPTATAKAKLANKPLAPRVAQGKAGTH